MAHIFSRFLFSGGITGGLTRTAETFETYAARLKRRTFHESGRTVQVGHERLLAKGCKLKRPTCEDIDSNVLPHGGRTHRSCYSKAICDDDSLSGRSPAFFSENYRLSATVPGFWGRWPQAAGTFSGYPPSFSAFPCTALRCTCACRGMLVSYHFYSAAKIKIAGRICFSDRES